MEIWCWNYVFGMLVLRQLLLGTLLLLRMFWLGIMFDEPSSGLPMVAMAMLFKLWALRALPLSLMLLLRRNFYDHPQSSLLSHTSDVSPPVVVQSLTVLAALRSFPRGTYPGSLGLRPQHLLDAVCGNTAPAASGYLQALTCCVNVLLSGKLDCRVAPWFCGAPLTVLIKPGGGFRPIAVGETLRCLVSTVCCLAVRSTLPDVFPPFGQVKVGVSGGLEAPIHSLCTILSTLGSKLDLCCLKVDMSNAFNEYSHSSFLSRCKSVFLSFLVEFNGVTVVQGSCVLDPTIFYPLLESSRVTLGAPSILIQ